MADGIVSNLAATALESLAKVAVQEAISWWGARGDLKKLENTISFIQARVRDAERRQEAENSDVIKLWLGRLKRMLYRADDLFDEVLTLDRQNRRMESSTLAKVGILFSRSGPFYFNAKLAHEIRSIRRELGEIKGDMDGFNFRAFLAEDVQRQTDLLMRKRQTASVLTAGYVIGRENDKKVIIEMLFDPIYDEEQVTVIPIVGLGGLGKTTLAQLVFNDERVQMHFDLMKWICIPEVDNQFAVLKRVYKSVNGEMSDPSLDDMKTGIRKSLNNNKYLLVLDDIWDDSRVRWLDLICLLECGCIGSKVIVTTRSDVVAKVVGTVPKAYKLGFLKDVESWNLFRRLAFKENQEESNPKLTQIGKEIVDSCGNVPLAIRVVGSLLYSKDSEREWQLFRRAQLSKSKLMENSNIMHVLKLSYDYLPPALKQCFAYCSLFPKDHIYSKTELVLLWTAQGYIEPSNVDIGEQYFMELLGGNFFQDPKEDYEGNIQTCKMHDLVLDLAQHVAGDEVKHFGEPSVKITDGLTHVCFSMSTDAPPTLLNASNMRSLIFKSKCGRHIKASSLERVVFKCKSLRSLDLSGKHINVVPNCIGRLIHLRYLNLASTDIRCLPNSLTRLENLQTLNLKDCSELTKLPRDFAKLANIRHLSIQNCVRLTDLPFGFGKMTSLQQLDRFIVGESNGIDSLPSLSLTGKLFIEFREWRSDAVVEAQTVNLRENQQLTNLTLKFHKWLNDIGFCEWESFVMDKMLMYLQLPPNIKYLSVSCYSGVKMPCKWFDGLSELVSIHIGQCTNCRVIPHMSQLPHLKSLHLQNLSALEYIEVEDGIWDGGDGGKCSTGPHIMYFPSLELLKLFELPKLKGWTKRSKDDGERRRLLFPSLLKMHLFNCPKLMSMPLAPKLESLDVGQINGKLFKSNLISLDDQEAPSSSSSTHFTSLKWLIVHEIRHGLEDSLSISSRLCNLEMLEINFCDELRSLIFESPNSIRDPRRNLTEIPEEIGNLSELRELRIGWCPKLTEIPEEIGNLSKLRVLQIRCCPKLVTLPPSIQGLTSLKKLVIEECPDLKERYEKANDEDCHLFQHIPHVEFK